MTGEIEYISDSLVIEKMIKIIALHEQSLQGEFIKVANFSISD